MVWCAYAQAEAAPVHWWWGGGGSWTSFSEPVFTPTFSGRRCFSLRLDSHHFFSISDGSQHSFHVHDITIILVKIHTHRSHDRHMTGVTVSDYPRSEIVCDTESIQVFFSFFLSIFASTTTQCIISHTQNTTNTLAYACLVTNILAEVCFYTYGGNFRQGLSQTVTPV